MPFRTFFAFEEGLIFLSSSEKPAVVIYISFDFSPDIEYCRFNLLDFSPVSMIISELFFVRNMFEWTGESEFRLCELDFIKVLILFADGLFGNYFGAPCLGSSGESTRAAESTCG